MLKQVRPAILMTVLLTVLTGLMYPLIVTAASQLLFHSQANGSLLRVHGQVVGSRLIGQKFTKAEYFQPRPSAAGANGYDASASGGSNLGPTNPDLAKRLLQDAAVYRAANGVTGNIPAEAITTSGSGLDPEISPANAMLQVHRVAAARHLDPAQVAELVQNHVQMRQLGLLGEPRVNVLELNLALDSGGLH
jgi:K+-transporting ATPase ATPase C chain